MHLPYDPVITPLGIYPRETVMFTKILYGMSTAAFSVASQMGTPTCPSVD